MSTFAVVIMLLLSTGLACLGATKVSRTFTLERDSAAVREVQARGVDISGSPLTTLPPADLGLESTASRPLASAPEALVLVWSARSERSREAASGWSDVLQQHRWDPGRTVTIAIDDPTAFRDTLRGLPAGVRIVKVVDAAVFARATGVSRVPSTLYFVDGRVRLVAVGATDEQTASLFLRVMGTRGVSAPAFPFVLDAASDMLDEPIETTVRPTDR